MLRLQCSLVASKQYPPVKQKCQQLLALILILQHLKISESVRHFNLFAIISPHFKAEMKEKNYLT